ncbi:MAG: ATP-binding cassette domain-containing protein [Eubacteriales bacterium]|nr:ATP-binding cassette domain-containing protein [Eubacteriales bacterium]
MNMDNNEYTMAMRPGFQNIPDYTQPMSGMGMNHPQGGSVILSVFDGMDKPRQIDLTRFGKSEITFGRNPENDIVLKSPLVSRVAHGRFILHQGRVWVEDLKSVNGLILNGKFVQRAAFGGGDLLRIDDEVSGMKQGVLFLLTMGNAAFSWKYYPLQPRMLLGRDQQCDITLNHVGVSRSHAEMLLQGNECYLRDRGSTNGTFVNGIRLTKAVRLQEKDLITITNTKIIYTSSGLYCCTYQNGLGIEARHIVKTVGSKGKRFNICNDVSLSIQPGELVAIIGGSGAGKTTFMNAISGYSKPTSGQVLINGQELYETYDSLKNIIGYVPQQDIVYDNLTLESMLMYAAKLRLPDDTTREERKARVQKVIEMVELQGKESTMIRRLSGGQKKRASIAVELLSDPKLFFLDEPASGLDPGTERNLMKTLKNMTRDGKTVILVTHSTLNLQNCDKIVFMGKGGNLCYFGNMKEAERFFQVENLVDVYNMITDQADYWRHQYDTTEGRNQPRLEKSNDTEADKGKSKHSPIRQIGVLSSRYMQLLLNDRQRLLLVLLQAPLLALLISLVKDDEPFTYYTMTKSLLFALSCSAFWVGTLNAIQEICKERVILRREYMTGLHLIPYIVSKFLVLGLLCFVESLLLVVVFVLRIGAPEEGVMMAPVVELFITTFLTAMAASGMGLFASAMFKNPDRAMTVAPILLMPQILFSGLLFELEGATKYISWFAVCRWSMEGYGSTSNLNNLVNHAVDIPGLGETVLEREAEDFFTFTAAHLSKDWFILLAFVVVFAALSTVVLLNIRKSE